MRTQRAGVGWGGRRGGRQQVGGGGGLKGWGLRSESHLPRLLFCFKAASAVAVGLWCFQFPAWAGGSTPGRASPVVRVPEGCVVAGSRSRCAEQ